MKKNILLFILLLASGILHAQDYTDTVLNRYERLLLESPPSNQIEAIIGSLNSKNQWPDIDYNDTSRATWQPFIHLDRIRTLALAWANPRDSFYKNQRVWKTMDGALNLWIEKKYQSRNWWHNEIGAPQYFRDILILIRGNLSTEKFNEVLGLLAQLKVQGTGANLIWSADLGLHYAALMHNDEMITKCSRLLSNEIKITTGDGIQPDYSFHQHGARLQMFHYGGAFLNNNVRLASELRGTPWAYPKEKIDILLDFVLKGWQWMARGINTVPGTIDRAASRENALHAADIRNLIAQLAALCPEKTTELKAIYNRQNGNGNQLKGFKYFPYSDFAVYQRNNFSFFLKRISNRTLPSESINHENLKGQLMNSGDAYFISSGNEYFNLMPVWNWDALPGVTSFKGAENINPQLFTGSVSDGNSGFSVMDYVMEGDQDKNLSAHKLWACHDNKVICLIAGLQTPNNTGPIFTAMDQCRWQGEVTVNHPRNVQREGEHQLKDVQWIHHAGFAYIPLAPSVINLKLEKVTGSWSSINMSGPDSIITEKIFMPLLMNNASSSAATAEGYVIAFCKTARQANKIAKKPNWKILRNDSVCQALQFKDGTLMAAFFSADTLKSDNKILTVNKPCLIFISNHIIYASDPSHTGGNITVEYNGKKWEIPLLSDGSTSKGISIITGDH